MTRALLVLTIGICSIAVALAIAASRDFPLLVPAGDHQLRMRITGRGSPTVILETFGPAYLEIWNRIQPELAKVTRVVSYDHAGYWGSEAGPKPRDATRIARELHLALQNAHVAPPYILVGYSFGGPYIRVFASLYPDEILGMLFVDPAQEQFMAWLNRHFPEMNVVTDADRQKQDEWGSQWLSMKQAEPAHLPNVPITLISAAQPGGPLLQRLLPEWIGAHRAWLREYPLARHLITTNSGHGIFYTEPELVSREVKAMLPRR
jgi:pimeloyl-ACP methyl ester carboxylesterase